MHANPPAGLRDAETLVTSLEGGLDIGDDDAPYVGTLIADRYLVLSLIGRGGMGAVYRAEQIHLRKTMAVKLLHESLSARKQLISRFTREARAISRLSSPHTVMVYDFGRWGELFYLVMELLEGEALDAVLERDGPMPADRATKIALQMCDSLSEAHRAGIVHRDLKPENVMLVRNHSHPDFVKILDFGLAKVQGVDDPYTIHSQRDIFGTPYYMSPEQIRAGDIDERADIYALGALLFRMLTGQYVFSERGTFDILKAHLMEKAPRMVEVAPSCTIPEALEQIVAKALEKDPAKRFQTMVEFSAALTEAQSAGFAALPGLTPSVPAGKPLLSNTIDQATSQAPAQEPAQPNRPSGDLESTEPVEMMEQRARRSRGWRFALFVAVLVGGLAALTLVLTYQDGPVGGIEQEPNDLARKANPLGPESQAHGVIGKRQSETLADVDCFRLPVLQEGDDLTVRVSGVKTMDLAVTLHDKNGNQQLHSSHRGVGQGEVLRHLDARGSPNAVCVTQQLAPGQVAGESMSEQYTLKVEVAARTSSLEREPNDGNSKEIGELAPHVKLDGTLDGPADRDVYQLQGSFESRILRVVIDVKGMQGPSGLRLALVDGARRTLSSEVLRRGELHAVLAFAASTRQMPDRLVIERVAVKDAAVRTDEVEYTIQYQDEALADQPEIEPNNTEESASPLVLGAWQTGNADDAAGVDWLRIDGGDPSMTRIRIEAAAPGQSTYWLTVRDQGTQVDLRKILIQPGLDQQAMVVAGSGEGFLLRIQQVEAGKRGKAPESRYQVRARYLASEDER